MKHEKIAFRKLTMGVIDAGEVVHVE